jgi:hypothetical protein
MAIILRWFERQSFAEIGARLGLRENAARMRVERALERLRGRLCKRGITSSSAALAATLAAEAVTPAPPALAAGLSSLCLGAVAGPPLVSSNLLWIMASTKIKLTAGVLLVAGATTTLVLQNRALEATRGENRALREELARVQSMAASPATPPLVDAAELERLRGEHLELMRLRGEVGMLRDQLAAMSNAVSPQMVRERALKHPPQEAPFTEASSWSNAGLGTPLEAYETLNWARANGDTNVIANALAWVDDRTRLEIEAIFAAAPESVRMEFGTADAYILSLFSSAGGDPSRAVTGHRVLSENIRDDTASLLIEERRGDGTTAARLVEFVRIDGEWRQALDFDRPSVAKLGESLKQAGQH